jgi:inhibitor of cysteine peptidase
VSGDELKKLAFTGWLEHPLAKQMKTLLTSFAMMLLAGCATHSTMTLTQLDNGHEIKVSVGQVLVVELSGNRTTGYSWKHQTTTAAVLEQLGEPAYMQDSSPVGLVGAGGTEIWRFKAVKPGRERLRLEYVRPWEKDVAPAKIVEFDVAVGK